MPITANVCLLEGGERSPRDVAVIYFTLWQYCGSNIVFQETKYKTIAKQINRFILKLIGLILKLR